MSLPSALARLPFFYGWVIVAVAFVTMAISVSARTSFSLLLPPLLKEFGWDRGLAAGAFSFGFLVTAVSSPFVGRWMDRQGPRVVIETGAVLLVSGLFLAAWMKNPLQLYVTLGVLAGVGANLMTFTAHSLYLPNWFARRRAFALSIAFSGVGVGAIVLLPWLQTLIDREGWRTACWAMALLVVFLVVPLNLLVRHRPADLGLHPDGAAADPVTGAPHRSLKVVDPAWAAVDWTLARALRTARFWWIALGYFTALIAWYAVQVHQTKYLTEIGFSSTSAAWALGLVSVVAIPGQIFCGALADRIGREWIWTIGCLGFAICYAALIAMEHTPSTALLWAMVLSQGVLGYAITSVMGPIAVEIFEGRHYGAIFGTLTIFLMGGGAAGPWIAGAVFDATGTYRPAFILRIACCVVSAVAVWIAAPRNVRQVAGAA